MNLPAREPFDWLAARQARHGGLEMIRTAVRRGWLEGSAPELADRRRRLIEALMRLINDPATEATEREHVQAARIMVIEMTEANMRLALRGDVDLRPPRHRIRGRGDRTARRPRR